LLCSSDLESLKPDTTSMKNSETTGKIMGNMVSEARREKKIILHGVSFWCSKSSSNKATLLLGWSHRYKNSWPLRNIHISNDNGFLTFYVDVFFPLSLPRLLLDLTVYMSNTTGVL
jgi:hypothetical protein